MSKKVTAVTYMVLVPEIRGTGPYRYVRQLRIDRVRSGKPSLARGEIAIKLRLNFNEDALLDSIPEIELDVSAFITAPDLAAPDSVEVAV